MIRLLLKTVFAVLIAVQLPAVQAAPPSREGIAFFETKIRPILAKHCYECHAEDAAEVGGNLRLDTGHGMRRGGQSGLPAVVAGKPDKSLIVHALKYDGLEMPPDAPLPESVINDFVKWIEMGAPDPRNEKPAPKAEEPGQSRPTCGRSSRCRIRRCRK
jgi:Planctomycete cytochrome C.